ncbi:hypothetical protein MPTA5024_07490 [Microbispora sp. ATCC PTA-5024]|nr:hypothetical protein MPTA5024_07490 [Microbispora sp. ATCC PTA-5024]
MEGPGLTCPVDPCAPAVRREAVPYECVVLLPLGQHDSTAPSAKMQVFGEYPVAGPA